MTSRKSQLRRTYVVSVRSFPTESEAAVQVHHNHETILVRDLLNIVTKALGIRESNVRLFALFEGLVNPVKKLDENEEVHLPYLDVLSIQKWCFDVEEEKKAVKSDMGALKLLRRQAMSSIKDGRLKPNNEEMEGLNEYSRSSFPVDRQYMDIIHSMVHYGAIFVDNCTVITDLSLPRVVFVKGAKISVRADKQGLLAKSDTSRCLLPWTKLRSMNKAKNEKNIVEYEIYLSSHKLLKWLRLETFQAEYLMAATYEILRTIRKETKPHNASLNSTAQIRITRTKTSELLAQLLHSKANDQDNYFEKFDEF